MERVESIPADYSHTQRGPLCLVLYGIAIVCAALAWMVDDSVGFFITGGVGMLLALMAAAFHHLTVEHQGHELAVRFGPLPLFQRSVQYSDIQSVGIGRTLILDGWGIHYSIRGGWVWNLWGRDCVVLTLRRGTLRIGTDDALHLARFLQGKINQPAET